MFWRTVGNPEPAVVAAELARRHSPLLAELAAISALLSPFPTPAASGDNPAAAWGRLILAMLATEQQYATDTTIIPAAWHNPLSLRDRDPVRRGAWARFPDYASGIAAGMARLREPVGPYAPTRTLAELAAVWAPASDGNDPAALARRWASLIDHYRTLDAAVAGVRAAGRTGSAAPRGAPTASAPGEPPASGLTAGAPGASDALAAGPSVRDLAPAAATAPGREPIVGFVPAISAAPDPLRPMPYPPMVDLVVAKPFDGAGFDRCPPRGPRIVGVCDHITEGDPGGDALTWYARFFGSGGERARDALVDVVIGRDGRIGLLNDWRDPARGGTRAGWANGGVDGLEGIGLPFYRRFPAINEVLVSKEHVARSGQPLTDAQLEASAQLTAAVAQNAVCHWAAFPRDVRHDVEISQFHAAFATKPCPGSRFLTVERPAIIARARELLRAWQGGVATLPDSSASASVPAPSFTRWGLTLPLVADFFGILRRFNPDGTVDDLPFNPAGPLSLLWLARAEREGRFPEAESLRQFDAGWHTGSEWYATWEGGWVATLPLGDTRASWRWLDEVPAPAAPGGGGHRRPANP